MQVKLQGRANTSTLCMNETNHTTMLKEQTGQETANGDVLVFPASFGQQRLWFLDQLEPGSSAYNITFAVRLTGELNEAALQSSLNDLVARHETLRTTFATENDEPVQVTAGRSTIKLQVVSADEANLNHLLVQLSNQGFDLVNGPLLRVQLIRLSGNTSVLFFNIHHIVADAWSLGILYGELTQLYEQHGSGKSAALPELAIQYGDFAEWQQDWMHSEQVQEQLKYWQEQLADAPTLLELPTDFARPRVQTHNGSTLSRTLSPALAQGLRQLAQSQQCTLFILLLTAYNSLLSRYSGNADIVVGTPIAGRSRRELEPLIGFFVNTLAMRSDLSGNPTFVAALQTTKQNTLNAFRNQDLPFEKLVEELQPDRVMSYSPIFQVLFVLEHSAKSANTFSDLRADAIMVKSDTAKFDVSLFVSDSGDDLQCTFEYNTDLFKAETIERMLGHFELILESVVANPNELIGNIQLLSAAELNTVLHTFNDTRQEFANVLPAHRMVEQQAAKTPEHIALEDPAASGARLSYADLNQQANRLAHELIQRGIAPGKLVAISCERSVAMAVATLAVLKTGAAYVPVDPNYPAERIRYMLDDSKAALLLTQSSLLETLKATDTATLCLDSFDFANGNADNPNIAVQLSDALYTIYTSGSTGLPKGVVLAHAGLANLLRWQQTQPGLATPARTLQFASLSFDVSFQELYSTWSQGGTLVMINEALRKDLPALAGFVCEQQIERLYMPFAALQPLADLLAERSDLQPALNDVISAGEQLQVTPAIRNLFTRCGGRLHNQYGPSETHVVTALTLDSSQQPVADWPRLPTIGTPVANARCYILDANRQPVPVGVAGELYLAGVQVALEYLGQPELNSERFSADPWVSGERMYRSGDRARYTGNGAIEYLGRIDDQLKFRGFRIEPGEIETAINQHPAVQLAAVVLRNAEQKKLVAYVTAEANSSLSSAELRDYLKAELPEYMVPTHIVMLDEMPLTPSGKIARRLLPEPNWEREAGASYTAPRNAIEITLAGIWAGVLGVAQVGIHDDFFDLGGHSLLATQVISRVRAQLSIELPLLNIFEEPTVAGFARYIDTAPAIEAQPIAVRDPTIPAALSFAQQRLWFLEQLDPGNPAYNFPIATRFTGQLNLHALQQAVDALIARHESLRTRFIANGQTPQQDILPGATVTLERVDLRGAAAGVIQDKLTELSQLPFDLTNAPLLRAHLLETDSNANDSILLLVTHHIVSDGWSLSVLFSDLTELYNSFNAGRTASLPALSIQYADYASWQRAWFDDNELKRQLDFWRAQLKDADSVLELPTDKLRPVEQSYRGASVAKQLSAASIESIKALAQQHQATLFMTLLAVFNVLLARYARQQHIVVGTPIAGRKRPELENLIGFFSNTLALHTDLSADPDFSELLAQIKRNTLAAYDHQDLPFEKLVEELRPVRDMSRSPIFQTMFVLQNTPVGSSRFAELRAESVNFEMGIAKFDVLLEVRETANGLQAGLQYNADLFVPATIERMLEHFECLLNSVAANPATPVSKLSLLDDSERQTVLKRFNASAVNYGALPAPAQAVEQQVQKTPDAIAIEAGTTQLTYRELNARANRLAHALLQAGAKPGTLVGLCAGRSVEAVVSLLAILKTGAGYVPIDPDYPAERIAYMLSNSKIPLLLTSRALGAALPVTAAQQLLLDEFDWQAGNADNLGVVAQPEDPLYVIHTSGSTGQPKAVVLPQKALSNLLAWQTRRPGFSHAARTLQYASLSFDVHHQEIFPTWASGGTLVLIDQELRQDLPALVRFISEQRIERLWMPFAALQPTAEIMAGRTDLEFSLQQICTSGEQLQVTPLIRQFFLQHPHIGFHNEYGPSEAHVVSIYDFASGANGWAALPPIGKPVPNTQLYILDQHLQPCPIGVPGELYIGGCQLASGYLNQPEATAAKFIANPFADAAPESSQLLYKTGDLARYLPDGDISYLGRADDQVKFRGFRIEPGEIETALTALPGVKLAAVLLREDHPGDKRLVGYITAEPGSTPDVAALRSELLRTLPEYMVPAPLIVLDVMPLTPSGKLSRRDLPVPELARDIESFVAPRNDTETKLAKLFSEILKLEPVGIHDDFFALGGHSLLATQFISRVRDVFRIELPLKYVFRYPSVATLAEQVSAMQLSSQQTAVADDADDLEDFEI
jgi:amino acid adenylation domain-containing protein